MTHVAFTFVKTSERKLAEPGFELTTPGLTVREKRLPGLAFVACMLRRIRVDTLRRVAERLKYLFGMKYANVKPI